MDKRWKALIVTAGKIVEDYYKNDPAFNNDNWVFFNVSKEPISHSSFKVVNSADIPGYEWLGKDWAESEVIYNIAKLNLFQDAEYLGIVHWDFNLFCRRYQTSRITENINKILDSGYSWISFFSGQLQHILGLYNVLLDDRKPNCLFVKDSGLQDPVSANDYVMQQINKMLGIKFNLTFLQPEVPISLCCSFLTERERVVDLGQMIAKIKESRKLDGFDTQHRHRIQGQVMERLIAAYSCFFNKFDFTLDHRFIGGQELNTNDKNGENY